MSFQEVVRSDVFSGVETTKESHLADKNTWRDAENFRFYRNTLTSSPRKVPAVQLNDLSGPDSLLPFTPSCNITTSGYVYPPPEMITVQWIIDGVKDMVIQEDGKIVVAGSFSHITRVSDSQSFTRNAIVRFLPDGTYDTSFGGTGFTVSGDGIGRVLRLIQTKAGQIYAYGRFTDYNGMSQFNIVRMNQDGSPDLSFVAGMKFDTSDQLDGGIVLDNSENLVFLSRAVGRNLQFNGVNVGKFGVRILPTATLDTGFNPPDIVNGNPFSPYEVGIHNGNFYVNNDRAGYSVVKLNTDGTLDDSFVSTITAPGGGPYNSLLQVMVVTALGVYYFFSTDYSSTTPTAGLLSYSGTSTDLTSYPYYCPEPEEGLLTAFRQISGGLITVQQHVESFTFTIRKMFSDGTVDSDFAALVFDNSIETIVIDLGGYLTVGGRFQHVDDVLTGSLVRLKPDGTLYV